MPTHNDLLLGQIAVRRGLVTLEHLVEALQEQAVDTPPGDITVRIRRYQRPLGVILVARQMITDAQLLSLLQEQKARLQMPADYADLPREKVLFGQIVLREGLATPAQVHKTLRIQSLQEPAEEGAAVPAAGPDGNGQGRTPRIGEIMVQRGYLQPGQVLTVLQFQTKGFLHCPDCGRRYNVPGYDAARQYRCRRCGELLDPVTDLGRLAADESGFLPPVSVPLPPGTGDTQRRVKP